MKTLIYRLVLLSSFLLLQVPVSGQTIQDTTQLWRIETTDGNNFIGYILEQDAETILLRTEINIL